jgi:hypothetical protein
MEAGKWMRQGCFKAVLVPTPYGDSKWRLFNIGQDPEETNDLSSGMPDFLGTMVSP